MSDLGSSRNFVWSIVTAQMLVQIGAFSLPALLPAYIDQWHLTKTEAGSLVGVFYAAYVVAVPLLVALTDRVPARNVYLVGAGLTAFSHLGFAFVADGFWSGLVLRAAAGIGWAGAYMPGLKAIADALEGNAQSRAVAAHAAGVGVASASSFAIAGLIASMFGNQVAFLFGGICALIAIAIALSVMPNKSPAHAKSANPRALLDFRPVFRNHAAMAWIAGYTFHTWEMAGLRAWGVTFLTLAAAEAGAPAWLPTPTVLFTLAGFAGIVVSVSGNEIAQRFGRKRIVTVAMMTSAALAICTGWTVGSSAPGC
jgi:MFS family permease